MYRSTRMYSGRVRVYTAVDTYTTQAGMKESAWRVPRPGSWMHRSVEYQLLPVGYHYEYRIVERRDPYLPVMMPIAEWIKNYRVGYYDVLKKIVRKSAVSSIQADSQY